MKATIKMKLLSDTVFGSGNSVPGGEDLISLTDAEGFPYFRAGTFKGIFREELENYCGCCGMNESETRDVIENLLGKPGDDTIRNSSKLHFSDFQISEKVRDIVRKEIGYDPTAVIDMTTHLRTFVRLSGDGMAEKGSLRTVRCVNKGLVFYSTVDIPDATKRTPGSKGTVREVLQMISWIGTMRSRGFGHVEISLTEEMY